MVDLFTNIRMIEHGSEKEILGQTYEYCLSKFAEQEGKLAGECYRRPAWCAHWWRSSSPTTAGYMKAKCIV